MIRKLNSADHHVVFSFFKAGAFIESFYYR